MKKLLFLLVIILALSPCLPTTIAYDEFDEYDDFDDWLEEYDLDEIDLIDDYFEFEDVFEDYDSYDYLEAAKQKKKEAEEAEKNKKNKNNNSYSKKFYIETTATPAPTATVEPIIIYEDYVAERTPYDYKTIRNDYDDLKFIEPPRFDKFYEGSTNEVVINGEQHTVHFSLLWDISNFHYYFNSYSNVTNYDNDDLQLRIILALPEYERFWNMIDTRRFDAYDIAFYNEAKKIIDEVIKNAPSPYTLIDNYYAYGGVITKHSAYYARQSLTSSGYGFKKSVKINGRYYKVTDRLIYDISDMEKYFKNYVDAIENKNLPLEGYKKDVFLIEYNQLIASFIPNKYSLDHFNKEKAATRNKDDLVYFNNFEKRINKLIANYLPKEIDLREIDYKLPLVKEKYEDFENEVVINNKTCWVDINLIRTLDLYKKYFDEYLLAKQENKLEENPKLQAAYKTNLEQLMNINLRIYEEDDFEYIYNFIEEIKVLLGLN